MAETCTFESFNSCLEKYYKSLGKSYDNLFTTYCDENGYEEEDIDLKEEVYQEDPDECMMIEFDEDFPFQQGTVIDDDKTKSREMQKIFQYIFENGKPPNISGNEEKVQEPIKNKKRQSANLGQYAQMFKQAKNSKTLQAFYKKQVPFLGVGDHFEDDTFMKLLDVGKKSHTPLLLYFVDAFNRDRIIASLNAITPYTTTEWLIELKPVIHKDLNFFNNSVKAAIESFGARISPNLLFQHANKIQDSLVDISLYIAMCSLLVRSQCNMDRKPPFHMDFVIAVNKVKDETGTNDQNNDQDDDDDDTDDSNGDDENDDDNKNNDGKAIRDVEQSFDKDSYQKEFPRDVEFMNLREMALDTEDQKFDGAVFDRKCYAIIEATFDNFYKKMGDEHYPHRRRFVGFVDRRQSTNDYKDSMTFFDPKGDCNKFTADFVSETYFASSRHKECMYPVQEAFGGELLTISFHVDQVDVVRCYLFFKGQSIRFYPQDIIHVLPKLFDLEVNNNKRFAYSDAAVRIANQIKIKDVEFEKFYQMLHKNSNDKNKKFFPGKIEKLT